MTTLALRPAVSFVLATLAAIGLASCGSGGVSAPATAPVLSALAVSPATATLYANQPTTFIITGGTGTYIVTSSDQNALSSPGAFTSNTLTVVPNNVAADTPVTLVVRDSGTSAPVSAALTVKPRTVSNVVTVTPTSTQPAACGTALCAGGDAVVKVSLALNGVLLVNREVRFEVTSGDLRIITSPVGLPETLGTIGSAVTDSSGVATIRVRAPANANAQTSLLTITDVTSGSTQRASVAIALSSNAPLNAQPNTITFQGVAANTCANGISAEVIVFGGRPPYQISQPGSFIVSPTFIATSGGTFNVTAIGQCSSGSAIAVVDAAGATTAVTATNKLSDVPATAPTTPTTTTFAASPTTTTLTSCTDVSNITLAGGSGTYFGSSEKPAIVMQSVAGSVASIRRVSGSGLPGVASITVQFSDGKTVVPVTVNLANVSC